MNKVSKSLDKDQDTPENVVNFKELLLYTIALEKLIFKPKNDLKKQNTSIYKNLYSYNNINDCFHPPQV